jgi:hypothetical protein
VVPSAAPAASSAIAAPPAQVTATPAASDLLFRVSADQARMTGTLVSFIDAYNTGRVDVALGYLTPDTIVADCDYRSGTLVEAHTIDGARQWLRDRVADHDQLVIESFKNENPDPSTGSHVVAISYARRTSGTLMSLGFPAGIKPDLAGKIVFNASDDLMRLFAGGQSNQCHPP